MPNTSTLFVGDTAQGVGFLAKKHDSGAILVNHENYHSVIDLRLPHNTMFTSLGDLPKDLSVVNQIFDQFDQIIYVEPKEKWSDQKTLDVEAVTSCVQGLTEFLLFQINQRKNNVKNLDLSKYKFSQYLELVSPRKNNNKQLWICGGSDVAGVGVELNQRFGQLLADRLSLPVSFLVANGSSIEYQADQILRSDLRKDDLIVWGLPVENRIPFWSEYLQKVVHLNVETHKIQQEQNKIDLSSHTINKLLVDKNCFYQSLIHVYQVINFCNKIQAKLLIIGLTISDSFAMHLHDIKEFFSYSLSVNQYIDLANDNLHPGPIQHQLYADFCQSSLKKLNYI